MSCLSPRFPLFSTVVISACLSEERKRLTKCYKAASNSLDNNLQGFSLLCNNTCRMMNLTSSTINLTIIFFARSSLYTFDMMCHGHIFTQCYSSVIIMELRAIHTMLGTQTMELEFWEKKCDNVIMTKCAQPFFTIFTWQTAPTSPETFLPITSQFVVSKFSKSKFSCTEKPLADWQACFLSHHRWNVYV